MRLIRNTILISLLTFFLSGCNSLINTSILNEWEKTFGSSGYDCGYSVSETSDGGYILVGCTWESDDKLLDVFLIKTDKSGNLRWTKTFGGLDSDVGYSARETSDGGYILVGYTYSFGAGKSDVYLIKTDSKGNEEWVKTFGGSKTERGYSVLETSDGGYIIVGYTQSFGAGWYDVYLIKTDALGNELWSKTFGASSLDVGEEIQLIHDGYIIAGWTGEGMHEVYILKTDASGNLEWERTFGGNYAEKGHSIHITSDGDYIIAGWTYSFGLGESDIYLIKTDSLGNEKWYKTYGGSNSDAGHSVEVTTDKGFIITGYTFSTGSGESDVYLIKTDSLGNREWSRTFGGTDSDIGYSVKESSDGTFIIAGYTESYGAGGSDVYLIKTY